MGVKRANALDGKDWRRCTARMRLVESINQRKCFEWLLWRIRWSSYAFDVDDGGRRHQRRSKFAECTGRIGLVFDDRDAVDWHVDGPIATGTRYRAPLLKCGLRGAQPGDQRPRGRQRHQGNKRKGRHPNEPPCRAFLQIRSPNRAMRNHCQCSPNPISLQGVSWSGDSAVAL